MQPKNELCSCVNPDVECDEKLNASASCEALEGLENFLYVQSLHCKKMEYVYRPFSSLTIIMLT